MFNDLINKNVEIVVALGMKTPGGSSPKTYTGVLLGVTDEFFKLQLRNQVILISRGYVITVRET